MMLFKTALPALVALIYVSSVAAQITTALPWVPDDGPDGDLDNFSDDDNLVSGLILGTGSNGETTYLLTMSDDDDNNRPITATLVADAAGVTVLGAYSDEDDDDNDDTDDPLSESFSIGCGIQSGSAVCTYQRVGVLGSSTFTSVTTRTAAADTITVVASTGTAPSAAPTATGSGSGSGSGSTRTGSATASATATQSSGAHENASAGLFAAVLPLVIAAFTMA